MMTRLPHITKKTALSFNPVQTSLLQRQCACGQPKSVDNEWEERQKKRKYILQRAAVSKSTEHEVPSIIHEVLYSSGQPLDANIRKFMEPRFGHDFSKVRVHTDAQAVESAKAVNALAYTVGRDMVFGAGQYMPQTSAGRKLMAHELTHIAQQNTDSVPPKLILGHAGDVYEQEADQMAFMVQESNQADARPASFTPIQPGRVQGLFVTPIAAGGGYGGLLERDRRRTFGAEEPQTKVQQPRTPGEGDCNVQLCFLPLQVLIDQGVPPELAYIAAVHAYLKWDGKSYGFTRKDGERIGDARVMEEPRAGEPYERCVQARLRTIPSPTPGQSVSFTPVGRTRDIISYGADVYTGLRECRNSNCQSAKQQIQSMLIDDRRGLYDLFDENCETWARNVLSAACMEAPSVPGGGYGNLIQQILRETPGGDLYHLARRLLGRTRAMPGPTSEAPTLNFSDDQVRDWVSRHSAAEIRGLSTATKIQMINILLGGWISDEDVATIDNICRSVASASEGGAIRRAIEPQLLNMTSIGQRTMVRVSLSRMP